MEALVGVLYSGFCGAILFGKVLRIQSHAQVIFSDPIVIRFGPGIKNDTELGDTTGSGDEGNSSGSACPVLEFRIVNRLFNEVGGEIMDATLNVVANVNANDADPKLDSMRSYSDSNGTALSLESMSASDTGSESFRATEHSLGRFLDPFKAFSRKDHQTVDEDPSSRLVSKHIFSKMLIEASDHPFFKRVWLARHILDDQSPILKPRVRRHIRRNGGRWPERLNTHEGIRESLQFNQILVSLNGVSNISASDVYAQKIYDYVGTFFFCYVSMSSHCFATTALPLPCNLW